MRIYFEFSSVVKEELLFESLYYFSPGGCFVKRSEAICANLINILMGNSHDSCANYYVLFILVSQIRSVKQYDKILNTHLKYPTIRKIQINKNYEISR